MEETIQKQIARLPEALLAWYEKNARPLPWRETTDPYRVWLSEIMLQQTRVEAVKQYYTRFLYALPTISALAAAPDDQLFKLWEGLGYYTRAKNLKKAAITIVEKFGGVFPQTYEDILSLPGVGDYTAGAVASICFNLPTPAVDGNVLRVVTRITELFAPIHQPAVKKEISRALAACYPKGRCGDFTQSLMELGATVCIPNGAPNCSVCPANGFCRAHANGTQLALPVRPAKAARKKEKRTVFLLKCGGKIALNKRPEQGLLSGMWELPNVLDALTVKQAASMLEEEGFAPADILQSAKRKHIFTHIEWDMTCYCFMVKNNVNSLIWVTQDQLLNEIALPTAFKKFLELI